MHHPHILDAVEDLIGPDILDYHSTLFLKEAHSAAFVRWHQDSTCFYPAPHLHVTASVALSDASEVASCTRALPGSHRWGTLACFAPDARLTIATFNTPYRGRDAEIRAMLERLNTRYAQVCHGDFDHLVQGPNRIASRFRVENITHAGEKLVKRNCNFFRLRGAPA